MKNLLLVATSAIEPIFKRRKDCHNSKSYHITKRVFNKGMFEIEIIHKFSLEIPVVEFNESLRGIQILEGLEILTKMSSDAINEKSGR